MSNPSSHLLANEPYMPYANSAYRPMWFSDIKPDVFSDWAYDNAMSSMAMLMPNGLSPQYPECLTRSEPEYIPCTSSTQVDGFAFSNTTEDVWSCQSTSDPESDDQLWSPICPVVSPVDSTTNGQPIHSPPMRPPDTQMFHSEQPQRLSRAARRDVTPAKHIESKPRKRSSPSTSKEPSTRSKEPIKSNGRNAEKRAAHNVIEKRYRTNMNAKFLTLQKTISGTQHTPGDELVSLKKSEILSNAIAYMEELQDENRLLQKEVAVMRRNQNQNIGSQGWPVPSE